MEQIKPDVNAENFLVAVGSLLRDMMGNTKKNLRYQHFIDGKGTINLAEFGDDGLHWFILAEKNGGCTIARVKQELLTLPAGELSEDIYEIMMGLENEVA